MKQIKLVTSFKARGYQQSIFANSMNKNTLVVLPTGLGKTIIAIMQVVFYFNKFKGKKKILFLGPTKPLVEQQRKSFEDFFTNSDDFTFTTLTGLVSPKKREQIYKNSDFIFSTPQLIENDIVNRIINPNDFCSITFDEAHRGTGNYAYCFIAEEFSKANCNILALTASPGTSIEQIKNVIENLRIEHVEVKKYTDADVKKHVVQTDVEYLEVELNEDFIFIKDKLNSCFVQRLKFLKEIGFLQGKNVNSITKTDLLMLQKELQRQVSLGDAQDEVWKAISINAGLMKLSYGQELFESQEVSSAYNYFYDFFRSGKKVTKAIEELITDFDFREAFDKVSQLKKEGIEHPKLTKLKEVVTEQINENPDLKLIIFNQYRDTATKIVEEISKIKGLNPVLFVGQAKKSGAGISQKEQKRILDDFRESKYNILVSTSVGEEGLDIPKVDLVVFYEPIPSAIRTIQRSGRTGRFKRGKVIVLLAKNTRDIIMKHVAKAKERKMYQVLDKIRDEFSDNNIEVKKEIGLDKFINKKNDVSQSKTSNEENNFEIKVDEKFDDRVLIYVDSRENTDLIKELFRIDEIRVEAKKLQVGDIVISENIAIERKAKKDFIDSIIDKRLFPQLLNLAKSFKRPVLILEGEENLFAIRNLNANVIRSTLSAIAVDLRIPVIYTNSIEETAQMVRTITKRTVRVRKEISLASNKMSFSQNDEIEKVISSIPKINVVTAKNLLNHFLSIKKIVNAKEENFEKVEGIGKIRAKSLVNFFKREWRKE